MWSHTETGNCVTPEGDVLAGEINQNGDFPQKTYAVRTDLSEGDKKFHFQIQGYPKKTLYTSDKLY
jgi:hypothetical protein